MDRQTDGFRLVPKSTLDELEGPLGIPFQNTCVFWGPLRKNQTSLMKVRVKYVEGHLACKNQAVTILATNKQQTTSTAYLE